MHQHLVTFHLVRLQFPDEAAVQLYSRFFRIFVKFQNQLGSDGLFGFLINLCNDFMLQLVIITDKLINMQLFRRELYPFTSKLFNLNYHQLEIVFRYHNQQGGGPRVVVSTDAFHARVQGSVPGLGGLKETKMFLPHPRVKVSIVGSLRDQEVAYSASDRQGSNFESCVWRTVSSQSSHHSQEVLLAQFSLFVHKGGLKPYSFYFYHKQQLQVGEYYSYLLDL